MKKPEYKVGDYVEFKTHFGLKRGFIKAIGGPFITVTTRKGSVYTFTLDIDADTSNIFRKLPINRDKNGRFASKKKDCSCFNCDKCAEQMRAYYEKTGELAKKQKEEFGQKPYDDFGSRLKVEEKKPSDRIDELFEENRMGLKDFNLKGLQAIADYLDEQFEKNK